MNVIHSKSSSLRHYSNFNETLRVSTEKKNALSPNKPGYYRHAN